MCRGQDHRAIVNTVCYRRAGTNKGAPGSFPLGILWHLEIKPSGSRLHLATITIRPFRVGDGIAVAVGWFAAATDVNGELDSPGSGCVAALFRRVFCDNPPVPGAVGKTGQSNSPKIICTGISAKGLSR